MKRYILILVGFLLILAAAVCFAGEEEYEQTKIYFVDSQIFRLIGVNTQIEKGTPQAQAREVLDILIEGYDYNNNIKRVLPKVKKGMKVKVVDNIAYVDIKPEMVKRQEKAREIESLAIYSIVNSLIEIEGIDAVRFTIDGMICEKYAGFIDMRETFAKNDIY